MPRAAHRTGRIVRIGPGADYGAVTDALPLLVRHAAGAGGRGQMTLRIQRHCPYRSELLPAIAVIKLHTVRARRLLPLLVAEFIEEILVVLQLDLLLVRELKGTRSAD